MHLFSIITSVYNGQEYIERAVNSIISQTENDYEYIIVDNGSNDKTSEILSRLVLENPNRDIKIVSIAKNRGISGGRNAGIDKAEGEYICFIDADDLWFANKLNVVKEYIIKYRDVDVFCHWEEHQKGKQKTIGKYRNVNNNDPYNDLLTNGNCLSTSAMTIRTKRMKEIGGFDTDLIKGEEDYDCWLRLAKSGSKFIMIPQPLGIWTIREDSVSSKIVQHTEAVIDMLKKHLNDYPNGEKIYKKVISQNLISCGRVVSLSGDIIEGNKLYKKALAVNKLSMKAYAGILLNMIKK